MLLVLAIGAFAGAQRPLSLALGIPAAAIASAAIIVDVAGGERSLATWLLCVPPLQWLGHISYSLYLWHPLVRGLSTRSFMAAPVALFVAWVSCRLIEQPFRALRAERFEQYPSASAGIPAGPEKIEGHVQLDLV
jgi:peptidoglycan/LPS O-acetylase OafA/YrhL